MAGRLSAAGHDLVVWSRTRANAEALAGRAEVAGSPAEDQVHHQLGRLAGPDRADMPGPLGVAEDLQQGSCPAHRLVGPADHHGQRALGRRADRPRHRGVHEPDAPLLQRRGHLPGRSGPGGRHVDQEVPRPEAAREAVPAEHHLLQRPAVGQHGDRHLGPGPGLGRRSRHLGPAGQRLGVRPGPRPDDQLVPSIGKAPRHGGAHPTEPEKRDAGHAVSGLRRPGPRPAVVGPGFASAAGAFAFGDAADGHAAVGVKEVEP